MTHSPPTYVREVAVKYTRRRLKHPDPTVGTALHSAREVAELVAPLLADSPREQLLVLHLDGRNRVAKTYEIVSTGTTTASLAHPREVFLSALLTNSSAMILVHCHPSGDPTPSAEDDSITERMCRVGELVGIRVLDHLVVGEGGRFFSYLESGRLPSCGGS